MQKSVKNPTVSNFDFPIVSERNLIECLNLVTHTVLFQTEKCDQSCKWIGNLLQEKKKKN